MQHGTPQHPQDSEMNHMSHATAVHEPRLDSLLSSSIVRPDVVARARRLLESQGWCHAEEVADRLVQCLVDNRLP